MRSTSNWTGRAPHTLEEAFGPHNRYMSFPDPDSDVVAILLLVAAIVGVAGLACLVITMYA